MLRRNGDWWRRRSAGAASVEFALVVPLLLTLLFGIIEFGFVFKDQLTLQQAAREGDRQAAVGSTVEVVDSSVNSAAVALTQASLTTTPTYRTLNSNGTWGSWTALADATDGSGTNNGQSGGEVQVTCTYSHKLMFGPLTGALMGNTSAKSLTLTAQSTMRRE